jgi:hypothetical protein
MQQIKFTTKTDQEVMPAGPMCSLEMKPKGAGAAIANTGAVSSAFVGFLV